MADAQPNKPAPAKPAATKSAATTSASAPPAPVTRTSDLSDEAEADAQQRTKDTWIEAHWAKWSSQADKDRSYLVVFDQSPPAVRAEVIRLLGGAEPALSTVDSSLTILEMAAAKPDLGPVQVALVGAEQFGAIGEAFDMDKITVKMPGQPGEAGKKRKAFVPVPKTGAG
ncbi:hypothetical protein BT67DRAFT_375053 [Trichocladium antarcticum]|uniref:Uncharacterized protein n=1 Tax=Trichocladium antarcticum TaxID=1450529 RepID=A0AAN6ZFS9_9PEZI|nr:hypothetical protein BT67DRAFT_375053 [Trichocladium antarcticum]